MDALCTAGTQSHNEQHEAGTAVTMQMAISLHCSVFCSSAGPLQTAAPSETSAWSSFCCLTLPLPVSHFILFPSQCFGPFLNSEASPPWLPGSALASAGAVSPWPPSTQTQCYQNQNLCTREVKLKLMLEIPVGHLQLFVSGGNWNLRTVEV